MLGPKIWAFACVILKSSMGKGRSKVYTIPVSSDHFRAVNANLMLFQVCQDDKTVDVGDRLVLVETDANNAPSGAVVACVVTYKQPGGALGIEPGHCVLGLYKKGLNRHF